MGCGRLSSGALGFKKEQEELIFLKNELDFFIREIIVRSYSDCAGEMPEWPKGTVC